MTGNAHVLNTLREKVRPGWTALLVVDMQNEFLREGGHSHMLGSDLSRARRAARACQKLQAAARAFGVKIVHIRAIYNLESINAPMLELLARKHLPPYCIEGSFGAQFHDGFEPKADEPVVTKHRYSGFYETDLHNLLQSMGIRTVVLTGVTTNGCVDATARDAFFRGYYVVMLRDCTAGPTPEVEEATFFTMDRGYGEVANSDEVVVIWRNEIALEGKSNV